MSLSKCGTDGARREPSGNDSVQQKYRRTSSIVDCRYLGMRELAWQVVTVSPPALTAMLRLDNSFHPCRTVRRSVLVTPVCSHAPDSLQCQSGVTEKDCSAPFLACRQAPNVHCNVSCDTKIVPSSISIDRKKDKSSHVRMRLDLSIHPPRIEQLIGTEEWSALRDTSRVLGVWMNSS